MPIVLISGPPHGLGRTLARDLAQKTGWPLYSRDQMVEEAHEQGIRLSRLETSIIKSPVVDDKLALEKELFLSFLTDKICSRAVDGNLVYSGRAAHLLLPGVSHLLRVGIATPKEIRIQNAASDLNIPQEKAVAYLESLDRDVQKWVHYVHREEYNDPDHFDLFLNLEKLSLENASLLLRQTADLPDFQPSEKSRQALDDRHLAARARIHLARNKETAGLSLGVRARDKVVTVTYMPRQEAAATAISKTLESLDGCRETLCTMAETNILYIQEEFDPRSDNFNRVTQLAKRWGAAVELFRLLPEGDIPGIVADRPEKSGTAAADAYTGGVEDDGPETSENDGGLNHALEELIAMGRSAGSITVAGGKREIIDALRGKNNYSMVILGDLFTGKGHQASTRLTRELGLVMHEKLKAPVISTRELESEVSFGRMHVLKLLVFAAITVLVYSLVFAFQKPILNFLGGDLHADWKWAASICVALFVPVIAYIYGSVAGLVLKLADID